MWAARPRRSGGDQFRAGGASRVQGGQGTGVRLGHVLEESADFRAAHVAGMPLVVKEDEATNPGGAIGRGGVVACGTHGVADLIEQPGRLGRCRRRLRNHGLLAKG